MNISEIKNLCDELSSISSSNEKKQWLLTHKNPDLDVIFKFLCDPAKITGLDKLKLNKTISNEPSLFSLKELLDYLCEHNTGSDKDIGIALSTINALSPDSNIQSWLKALVSKNLKIGINTKTLNSVYGKGYIYTHEVQLGSGRDKLRLKPNEKFWLTQKLNGNRATYVNGKLLSRQGKEFTGLEHIISELKELDPSMSMVFDGEIIRKNTDNLSDNENFRIGTGVLNSDSTDKSCLEFVIFDCVTLNAFLTHEITPTFDFRRQVMQSYTPNKKFSSVRILGVIYEGTDQNKIDEYLEYADKQNWEGLMLNKNAPYDFKRTTNLIKIKTFHFSDLKIINCLEGEGKYKGMLGALVVDYKGNPVNVGSGFSDTQRIEYWKNKNSLIGKIVEVKYKEESSDKNGVKSLQFPIFSRLREDKNTVSIE